MAKRVAMVTYVKFHFRWQVLLLLPQHHQHHYPTKQVNLCHKAQTQLNQPKYVQQKPVCVFSDGLILQLLDIAATLSRFSEMLHLNLISPHNVMVFNLLVKTVSNC